MTDAFLRVWRSESRFRADEIGCIDPSRDTPLAGTHAGPDPFGILTSMKMPVPTPDDWEAPEPRDFNDIRFTLSRDGVEIATAETRQWIFPPEIDRARGFATLCPVYVDPESPRTPVFAASHPAVP